MGGRPDGFTLTMARELPAGRAEVFQAFVDPDEFAKWFGPEGHSVSQLEFSPRAGARYRIEMRPPAGDPFHIAGEVCAVVPPSRLVFTFAYEEPNPDDVETRVVLSFLDLGESTRVDLTQGAFKTEARRALHETGWSETFDRLERFISARA